jgi:hypothetical protein
MFQPFEKVNKNLLPYLFLVYAANNKPFNFWVAIPSQPCPHTPFLAYQQP